MASRTVALLASLALIGLLAALTIKVMIDDGFTVIVGLSLVIVALLAFGVIGALTSGEESK